MPPRFPPPVSPRTGQVCTAEGGESAPSLPRAHQAAILVQPGPARDQVHLPHGALPDWLRVMVASAGGRAPRRTRALPRKAVARRRRRFGSRASVGASSAPIGAATRPSRRARQGLPGPGASPPVEQGCPRRGAARRSHPLAAGRRSRPALGSCGHSGPGPPGTPGHRACPDFRPLPRARARAGGRGRRVRRLSRLRRACRAVQDQPPPSRQHTVPLDTGRSGGAFALGHRLAGPVHRARRPPELGCTPESTLAEPGADDQVSALGCRPPLAAARGAPQRPGEGRDCTRLSGPPTASSSAFPPRTPSPRSPSGCDLCSQHSLQDQPDSADLHNPSRPGLTEEDQ